MKHDLIIYKHNEEAMSPNGDHRHGVVDGPKMLESPTMQQYPSHTALNSNENLNIFTRPDSVTEVLPQNYMKMNSFDVNDGK